MSCWTSGSSPSLAAPLHLQLLLPPSPSPLSRSAVSETSCTPYPALGREQCSCQGLLKWLFSGQIGFVDYTKYCCMPFWILFQGQICRVRPLIEAMAERIPWSKPLSRAARRPTPSEAAACRHRLPSVAYPLLKIAGTPQTDEGYGRCSFRLLHIVSFAH